MVVVVVCCLMTSFLLLLLFDIDLLFDDVQCASYNDSPRCACSSRIRQLLLVCCLLYGSFFFVCLFVVWWCSYLVVLAVIVLANHDTELGAALQRHLRVPVVEAVGRCHHVALNIMEHHGVAMKMCSSMIICHIFTLFRIVPPHMRHPPLLAHGWGVKGSKNCTRGSS